MSEDMFKNTHLVIMAGGIGSRFWPLSTPEKPKQFIDILGTGRTMIQSTVDRFRDICPSADHIWVVTSERYKTYVNDQLPDVPDSNILLEPCMRNTAPCIAYVTWKIKKRFPDANLVVSPSDHIVTNAAEFSRTVRDGLVFTADSDRILLLGMYPTRPETGYGYIQAGTPVEGKICPVARFREKPDLATAETYLKSGDYTWNSGLFLWNVHTIEKALREFEPNMAALFDSLDDAYYGPHEQAAINEAFPQCEKISIDYAVMERASNTYVLPASFGWSDLGTWGSLHELSEKDCHGNAVIGGNVKLEDCTDCIIRIGSDKAVALQGLKGCIVAEQNGAFLVCRKSEEQKIKTWCNFAR